MSDIIREGFYGASLKIDRAYRHINELCSVVDNINKIAPATLSEHRQIDGTINLSVNSIVELRNEMALPLGDAIHNLRSALDHVWSTLARSANVSGLFTFPFHETREQLVNLIGKSPVSKAFPSTNRLIFDEIKPHRDCNGNEILWMVTKFDNIDKHNLLIPTVEVTGIKSFNIDVPGFSIDISDTSMTECGNLFSGPGPIDYQSPSEISFSISFPHGSLLAGKPLIVTLIHMAQATEKSVRLFRDTFL